MARTKESDTLLTLSAIGLRVYIGFVALAIAVMGGGIVVMLVAPPADIARQLASAPPVILPLGLACAAIIAVILVLGILFALQLVRIIGTVKNGDPFEPANADRLTRMGWYALAGTVASWLADGMARMISEHFKSLEIHAEPVGGLALVVTLFILARVFRHGAAMRDDLIGTV